MKKQAKKWLTFALRWGIAAVGVYLVLKNITFRDRALVDDPATGSLIEARVVGDAKDADATFRVVPRGSDETAAREVAREQLWAKAYPSTAKVLASDGVVRDEKVIAVHPDPATISNPKAAPTELLVEDKPTKKLLRRTPSQLADSRGYLKEFARYPLVEIGLIRMVREADPHYLFAALAVIPIAFALTTYRWHLLLEAVGIRIGIGQTFATNMVGQFYNTFMPGSTGGDLVKAWYASKHTTHRTWAVISVLMDRAIGLLALILLGGVMATLQWHVPACRKVAIVSWAVLACVAVGMLLFYVPPLRRRSGLDYLLKRLPMQRQVHTAVEGLEMYGHDHPAKSLQALAICFPVHVISIVSAMLAGHAFGLPLPPMYYWVIVPVIVLVGAIPISPQGAGVMEAFAILLTRSQHCTISQAVALTLSIRLVQIFWNLVAGLFVLRGGYHAPTENEQHELEDDEPEAKAAEAALPVQV